jgi:hypothetical protein
VSNEARRDAAGARASDLAIRDPLAIHDCGVIRERRAISISATDVLVP